MRRVLDPFLGLGHSALACKALGLPFVGFELDADYFADACRSIEAFDPSAATRPSSQLPLF